MQNAKSILDGKHIPHNISAEQSVIGGLMINPSMLDEIKLIICATDFYHVQHRNIFEAIEIACLKKIPVDGLTIIEQLKKSNRLLESGGESFIFETIHNTPSASNIKAYAQIVKENSSLRKLLEASREIQNIVYDAKYLSLTIQEKINAAEKLIFEVGQSYRGNAMSAQRIYPLVEKAIKKLDDLSQSPSRICGLESGYKSLDDLTSGFQKQELIILAARPAMGKTSFAMNIAEHVSNNKKNVLAFSMEMSAMSLTSRLMSSASKVSLSKLRSGMLSEWQWKKVAGTLIYFFEKNIFIDESPCLKPLELIARARSVARECKGLDLIIVDYLQLMQSDAKHSNRVMEVGEISRSLKSMAKELDCPVIALSQLNRNLELRQDKRPQMSDLRDSGNLEQDADVIIFIYRDDVYFPDSEAQGIAEIIVAKQRNGERGVVLLPYFGKFTRFENPIDEFWDFGERGVKK